MKLYAAADLHSNNHFLAVIDENDTRILERRLPNDLAVTLKTLDPYRADIRGIAVESTFNWYWLVDGLMDAGYPVMLVNTAKARQYEGLKHTDDRHDAFWLAHQMRLGILPTGYIYPKVQRALRDLLRERRRLVRQRTTHVLSTQSTFWRHTAVRLPSKAILGVIQKPWPELPDANLELGVHAHRATIKVLTSHVERIERKVLQSLKPRPEYQMLLTVPGIGPVIAWTIVLETGDLSRFASAGHFASYCRCVDSKRTSNEKKKGENNVKNGNAYLAWAFFEAAHFAIQYLPAAKRFYQRKSAQRNPILAIKALAHKIARACYYIMRDRVPFDAARLFA
ncbi:MAG TPA: IS110 family transposase [Steroidobacteraceae bacterium]|jgi:transposase|nr:IS110 family transposase [Steroidobacteraceae bacterium]